MRTIDWCHQQAALLRPLYPGSCRVFERMAARLLAEENVHAEKQQASSLKTASIRRSGKKAQWGCG